MIRTLREIGFLTYLTMVLLGGCASQRGYMGSEYNPQVQSGNPPAHRGIDVDELTQMLEFCVDLNSQDDRSNEALMASNPDRYKANIDLRGRWKVEFDSRERVAHDLHIYSQSKLMDGYPNKLYQATLDKGQTYTNPRVEWSEDGIYRDARINGFGPYQAAWVLYKGIAADNAGQWVIAIRGTVFSSKPTVLEDLLMDTINADAVLSKHVRFAFSNKAAIHSGFAHGAFTLLLDKKYGILQALQNVPANSQVFVTGHSQGAALGTLVHAFLHYALIAPEDAGDPFEIGGKNFRLKSYVYAQPRLGNNAFAQDFASYTQIYDNAIVINNTLDPITQVPLTLEGLADVDGDLNGGSSWVKVVHRIAGVGGSVLRFASSRSEKYIRDDAGGYSYYFNYDKWGKVDPKVDVGNGSLDFSRAGRVYWVYGSSDISSTSTGAGTFSADSTDAFIQHHTWMYRWLIANQLEPKLK